MTALAQSVTIGLTTYLAGTDHTAMPAAVVDQIRNPGAWVGGAAPALSAPRPAGDPHIGPADMSTPARGQASLGLGDAATRDVGTTTGTVAAGDDSRFGAIAGALTAVSVKTANYTAAKNQLIPADADGGAFTVTLPTAVAAGSGGVMVVRKIDTSVNPITVACSGSDTINGSTAYVLSTPQASVEAISDGANWRAVPHRPGIIEVALVQDFGAKGDGTTDDTAAIQAACAAAGATGTVGFAAGTYKTTATLIFGGNVSASADAVISYTGSDTAVIVGTVTSGATVQRKRVQLPQVVNAAKTGAGWSAVNVVATVGVKLVNLNRSRVDLTKISGFETGLAMLGDGQGVAYVTVNVGHLDNNKVNQKLDSVNGGWANQNTFIGGSWTHNSNEGTNVAGTKHIYLAHQTVNADPNNNVWLNPSLESPTVVEFTLDVAGTYNEWINPRFEFTGSNAKVMWAATASRNWIFGGYGTDTIVETHTAGSFNNSFLGTNSSRFMMTAAQGIVVENGGSSNSAGISLIRAGGITLGDSPATAYQGRFQASAWKGKRFNDTADRVIVDTTNGLIQIGDGTAAPTTQWSTGTASPEGSITAGVGSLYSRKGGAAGTTLYVKESGTGNTGWAAYGAAPSADVQTYTASGTWTKPAGAKTVVVTLIAGGGGGGSGRKGLDGAIRCGGGAGSGGAHTVVTLPASALPSSVAVTVGTGGTGGAAQATDSTNGNAGANGTASTFAGFVRAIAGVGGGGGTASTGTGGSSSSGSSPGGTGASASTTGGAGGGPPTNAGSIGGCAGGGITSGNVANNGGSANSTGTTWGVVTGGTAGTVDTAAPTNGGAAPTGTPIPGAAGGGGAASMSTNAQAGGDGGLYGTGGSGGGAGKDTVGSSGAGGNGAAGIVQVVSYF